jgi:small-conductance mechanosensitive channel
MQSGAGASHAAGRLAQKSYALANEAGAWFDGNILGIVIAGGIGIAIAIGLFALRHLGCRLIARLGGDPHWPVIFARVLARTKGYFIVMASAELVAEHARTPAPILQVIHVLFVITAALQAAIWARELILGYVEHRVGASDEHSTLGSAVNIIRLLVTVALFAIAVILILSNLGVDVTGLVAGLGIGGIAIGLAAQGIFSDLFAALSILFDRPFRRGDSIKVDQLQGTVENIGLKTTRIRSLSGEQTVISNAKLLDQQIHNFANLQHRRFVLTLGLVYQIAPDVLAAVPDKVRAIVEAHEHTSFVRCGMTGFGASSVDFELQFDVNSADYEYAFATRSAVCLEILARFNAEGIGFAYPTQTSFTAAPDGTLVMPYPHVKVLAEEEEPSKGSGPAAPDTGPAPPR